LNPGIAQAWSNLINAYIQMDALDKAVEAGEKMLSVAPDFPLGLNNLAYAYFLQEEFQKAIQFVDRAAELGFAVHPEFLKELERYR